MNYKKVKIFLFSFVTFIISVATNAQAVPGSIYERSSYDADFKYIAGPGNSSSYNAKPKTISNNLVNAKQVPQKNNATISEAPKTSKDNFLDDKNSNKVTKTVASEEQKNTSPKTTSSKVDEQNFLIKKDEFVVKKDEPQKNDKSKDNLIKDDSGALDKNAKKTKEDSSSFKTAGSYFGVDAIAARTSYFAKMNYRNDICGADCLQYVKPAITDDSYALGLTYKYAVNFNGLFFAPGVFLETYNQRKIQGRSDGDMSRLQIKDRYGVKMDVGYDVNKFIAPYFLVGCGQIAYKDRVASNGSPDTGYRELSNIKSGYTNNVFYGAGLKLNLDKNFSLVGEYNFQKFNTKNSISGFEWAFDKSSYITRMHVYKLGLYYKF